MHVEETRLPGLLILSPRIFPDKRGYFFESYHQKRLVDLGIDYKFVQDNEAKSGFGVLRGLHYQCHPFAQAKLVRVISGEVLDVVVDIRDHSPTFGEHFKIRLSGENKKQLLVPAGFAHGYVVTTKEAIFSYKCDNYYAPDYESGIIYDDPTLGIDWEINSQKLIISEKDRNQPKLGNHRSINIEI